MDKPVWGSYNAEELKGVLSRIRVKSAQRKSINGAVVSKEVDIDFLNETLNSTKINRSRSRYETLKSAVTSTHFKSRTLHTRTPHLLTA
jgi:hypothetical protein